MAPPGSCDCRAAWQPTWPPVWGGSAGCGQRRLPEGLLGPPESGLGQRCEGFGFPRSPVASRAPGFWGSVVSLLVLLDSSLRAEAAPELACAWQWARILFLQGPSTPASVCAQQAPKEGSHRGASGSPKPGVFAQAQRAWLQGPVVKNIISLSVLCSLPTSPCSPPAPKSVSYK